MGTDILPRNFAPASPSPPAIPVFMFPGQSSVGPEILTRARLAHPAAEQIAVKARSVLGDARASEYLDPAGARLRSNRDTQITVFLSTQMYLAALQAEGVVAAGSLGLSLGEYSHLVHIGALDFEAALRLVDERGRCYDDAPAGIMATVLAVDHDTVASVVARARMHGPVVISNVNAPTQHVIAGAEAAVEWASTTLEDEHAAHVTVIERRVPMHSPLMAPVAEAFTAALRIAPWQTPRHAYLPNVTGMPVVNPTPDDFVTHLARHVSEPVLWQRSIEHVIARQPGVAFVEVGPGGVLHNMMGRAWRTVPRARVDAPELSAPREHFATTVEALRVRG